MPFLPMSVFSSTDRATSTPTRCEGTDRRVAGSCGRVSRANASSSPPAPARGRRRTCGAIVVCRYRSSTSTTASTRPPPRR